MVKMVHARYIGAQHGELQPGMTAILLTDRLGEPVGEVIAQLDRKVIVGTVDLALGWHKFPETDWEVIPDEPTDNLQDGGPMHAHLLNTNRKPENY